VVPREETVKGYEFAKGQYVTFTDEELDAVEEQSTGGIDIEEFVPIARVDPLLYAKAYYLAPDQGAARAYHLLAAALRKTGLCALAKYAARGKQYLTLVRAVDQGLILQQLHYPAEVRPIADVGIDDAAVEEAELDLAIRLIEQGAGRSFDPEKYTDEVRERVEALIQKKLEGHDITVAPLESPRAQVIDLMSALKQSLGLPAGGEAEPTPSEDGAAARAKAAAED
jgi:DNA end-binding protein Ku